MTSENKLIIPLITEEAEDSPLDSEQDLKKNYKSTTPKKDIEKKASLSWLARLALLIIFAVSIIAIYFSLVGNNNKWQIERINDLQSSINKLKEKTSVLEKKQVTNNLIDTKTPQINAIKDKLSALEETITQNTSLVDKQDVKIEPLLEKMQEFNKQQQLLAQQNNKLQKIFQNKINTAIQAITAISKLSNTQIQSWVLQINNQWLFESDKITTANNLHALLHTISLSDNPYQQPLSAKIRQDIEMIKNFKKPTIKLEKIKQLKIWLKDLKLITKKIDIKNQNNETTSWQKIKQKFNQLFSIRKKETANDLSIVVAELEKRIIKQRMLLQADQIGWAINSQALQVMQYAMDDISKLIELHAPEQVNTWLVKMIRLVPESKKVKSPLSITEIKYDDNN